MSVKDNIRKLRRLTKTTQQELADIAGVSRSAVSLWEIGKSEPRMGAIQSMADHFHIRKSNIIEDGGMDRLYVGVEGKLHEQWYEDDEEEVYQEVYKHRPEFGEALGEILKRRNVSNEELAYRMDVPTSYVDDIVNCVKHDVSLARAFQIADAIGLSFVQIVEFIEGNDMIDTPEQEKRRTERQRKQRHGIDYDELIAGLADYIKNHD